MRRSTSIFFALFALVLSAPVRAELLWPVGDAGNGHYYELVREQDITWEEAKVAAENSYNSLGWQGHLATINTPAEQNFLISPGFLGNSIGIYGDIVWLGGFQIAGTPELFDEGWQWVTGEPWDYTNWQSGLPNHTGNSYLRCNTSTWDYGPWLDAPNNQQTPATFSEAYIIEYEPAAVPEPSVMALFCAGLIWIVRGARRR